VVFHCYFELLSHLCRWCLEIQRSPQWSAVASASRRPKTRTTSAREDVTRAQDGATPHGATPRFRSGPSRSVTTPTIEMAAVLISGVLNASRLPPVPSVAGHSNAYHSVLRSSWQMNCFHTYLRNCLAPYIRRIWIRFI